MHLKQIKVYKNWILLKFQGISDYHIENSYFVNNKETIDFKNAI